eukprot:12931892-Prorocentrum_lima.AAC.1
MAVKLTRPSQQLGSASVCSGTPPRNGLPWATKCDNNCGTIALPHHTLKTNGQLEPSKPSSGDAVGFGPSRSLTSRDGQKALVGKDPDVTR